MGFLSVLLIAVGLAMDAFAVAVANGIAIKHYKLRYSLVFGIYFGLFQGLMPVAGFLLGRSFSDYIISFDHWIAFGLLALIGGKMIYESFRGEDRAIQETADMLSFRNMSLLAVATSIDAMAVGVSFAMVGARILSPALIIGVVTFLLSAVGVYLGNKLGGVFRKGAEIFGGVILIAIGVRILVEHLMQ